ncbi:hypothetical protein Lal_00023970 [Lupinus albus]|nr:hypothetical protein Lal_00023970 [Lupinus albus]
MSYYYIKVNICPYLFTIGATMHMFCGIYHLSVRQCLEAYDFRISQSKMEHKECKFSKRLINFVVEVKIENHTILQITRFRYLRSIIKTMSKLNEM